MEDGEIYDEGIAECRRWTYEHDATLEWPGPEPKDTSPPHSNQILRFVVHTQSSVTGSGKVALVDGYDELHFGRDASPAGSQTPRVRIKSMEVSKHHATVYRDLERGQWAIVDMGSMHGTFLRTYPCIDADSGQRLSSARTASIPRPLSHLDALYFGTTGFTVHIHSELPCEDCSPSCAKDEIPLFPSPHRSASHIAPSPVLPTRAHPYAKDSKKAISALKRELLARHQHASTTAEGTSYVDRSARRRALYPSSACDAPGAVIHRPSSPHRPAPLVANEPVSDAQAPLSASNVGHMLLMKQGWQPGFSLGLSGEGGTLEPLDGAAMAGRDRRGLGVHKG